MDAVIWEARPELHRPVMVAAFEGWNDAADAASGAVDWLRRRLKATNIARIDPEEFYDFQATRPEVSLIDGTTRKVSWPANECFAVYIDDGGVPRGLVVSPDARRATEIETVANLVPGGGVALWRSRPNAPVTVLTIDERGNIVRIAPHGTSAVAVPADDQGLQIAVSALGIASAFTFLLGLSPPGIVHAPFDRL